MKFIEIAFLFSKLEKTPKRLEKILILRDFYLENKKETPLIFDIISSNFQREINKKNLGISLKTIFLVISFVSNCSEKEIEKKFNKLGDVGELASFFISKKKQKNLSNKKDLDFLEIKKTLLKIVNLSGKDSNKVKKELLSKLFLSANSKLEYKFLARLLIDDLRIGVNVGVLKETMVNSLFPSILNIQLICSNCLKTNLNLKKCYNCRNLIETKKQEELIIQKLGFEIIEIGTPKGEIGLKDYFNLKNSNNYLNFALRLNRKKHFIKTLNSRELYNTFLELFEKKYNLTNSFSKVIKDLSLDLSLILKLDIEYFKPIKSMLGTRVNNIEEAFKISKIPAFVDFKYDGLRVQIHNLKGNVKIFSRNLEEITPQFPEIIDYIKMNFSDISFVLDSECVAYDFEKQKFLEFQILSKRILSKKFLEIKHIKIMVKVFDIMKLNDETLIENNYEERRKVLENLLVNRPLKQELNFKIDDLLNKLKIKFKE